MRPGRGGRFGSVGSLSALVLPVQLSPNQATRAAAPADSRRGKS